MTEPGVTRALRDGPAPDAGSARIDKFRYNDGALVTRHECRIIAARLGEHRSAVHEVASFFDDAPGRTELDEWLNEWIAFNERAAEANGYRVR